MNSRYPGFPCHVSMVCRGGGCVSGGGGDVDLCVFVTVEQPSLLRLRVCVCVCRCRFPLDTHAYGCTSLFKWRYAYTIVDNTHTHARTHTHAHTHTHTRARTRLMRKTLPLAGGRYLRATCPRARCWGVGSLAVSRGAHPSRESYMSPALNGMPYFLRDKELV